MTTYRVVWEIDIDADSPQEAVAQTKQIQLDPYSEANFFSVTDAKGKTTQVHLIAIDDEIIH